MKYFFLVSTFFLSSCSFFPTRTAHDFCALYTPIRFTKAEYAALSKESAQQILVRNQLWEQKCK